MYAVMFEIEESEFVYDTGKQIFTDHDSPVIFKTKKEAQKQADKWNTGVVVSYIRPMTKNERNRSKEREAINRVYS